MHLFPSEDKSTPQLVSQDSTAQEKRRQVALPAYYTILIGPPIAWRSAAISA